MHMLSANSPPLLLEMPSVLSGARSHSHQNAAVADASFILFGTLFRDAPIAKHSNKANRHPSGASSRQCHRPRPRENQAQAGKRHDTHRDEGRDYGANCSPHGPAHFATLFYFAAQINIDLTIVREVASTSVIGHDHADVRCAIAALRDYLVRALDTLAVSE